MLNSSRLVVTVKVLAKIVVKPYKAQRLRAASCVGDGQAFATPGGGDGQAFATPVGGGGQAFATRQLVMVTP